MKVVQEFYCGECEGYITVKLDMDINRRVNVCCPNCGHKHHRRVSNGVLRDDGVDMGSVVENLIPMKAAYHKKNQTLEMGKRVFKRHGVPITRENMTDAEKVRQGIMTDAWRERYGDRVDNG